MTQIGTVTAVPEPGAAVVQVVRQSACAHDCGNYLDMNLPMAKYVADKFYREVLADITKERMHYPA